MAKRTPKTSTTATTPETAGFTTLAKLVATVNPSNVIATVKSANVNHGITFATRNVGRYTGMRIVAFQNTMLERNRTAQLDDCQLAAMMAIEFPAAIGRVFAINGAYATPDASAIRNAIAIVGGIRSDYNRTGHGGPKPATPVDRFGASRFDVADTPKPAAPATRKTRKSA